jgi:hypothetical protein
MQGRTDYFEIKIEGSNDVSGQSELAFLTLLKSEK